MNRTAIGCRVKSGRAIAVLLSGPAHAPRVEDRREILLSDPAVPGTVQPFHAGFGTAQTNRTVVARLTRLVSRCAALSFGALLEAYDEMGHRPARLGIVVGSLVDPALIANQHIRAHAEEGRLFRTVLEEAARSRGIKSLVWLEKELYATAARQLGGAEGTIRKRVSALGRSVAGPWRAEEKTAALSAWLVLTLK